MLRILRYSPNATTKIVQSEHSQEINASHSGTDWFIDFSVDEGEKGGPSEPPQGKGGMTPPTKLGGFLSWFLVAFSVCVVSIKCEIEMPRRTGLVRPIGDEARRSRNVPQKESECTRASLSRRYVGKASSYYETVRAIQDSADKSSIVGSVWNVERDPKSNIACRIKNYSRRRNRIQVGASHVVAYSHGARFHPDIGGSGSLHVPQHSDSRLFPGIEHVNLILHGESRFQGTLKKDLRGADPRPGAENRGGSKIMRVCTPFVHFLQLVFQNKVRSDSHQNQNKRKESHPYSGVGGPPRRPILGCFVLVFGFSLLKLSFNVADRPYGRHSD